MSDNVLTLDGLKDLLVAAAGEPEGIDLEGDILDVTFEEMGYDSIALLETSSRIEREFGVSLGDTVVAESASPGDLLRAVNQILAGSEAA